MKPLKSEQEPRRRQRKTWPVLLAFLRKNTDSASRRKESSGSQYGGNWSAKACFRGGTRLQKNESDTVQEAEVINIFLSSKRWT